MTVDSVQRANALQNLALQEIHSQYQTEKPKDLFEMTLEDLLKELDEASANGTLDELNQQYSSMLLPQLDLIMQQIEGQNG